MCLTRRVVARIEAIDTRLEKEVLTTDQKKVLIIEQRTLVDVLEMMESEGNDEG